MMLLANLRDVVFIPSLFLLFLSGMAWHGTARHGKHGKELRAERSLFLH
jgi:hypothetical protein